MQGFLRGLDAGFEADVIIDRLMERVVESDQEIDRTSADAGEAVDPGGEFGARRRRLEERREFGGE